jgi:hypothetical protein
VVTNTDHSPVVILYSPPDSSSHHIRRAATARKAFSPLPSGPLLRCARSRRLCAYSGPLRKQARPLEIHESSGLFRNLSLNLLRHSALTIFNDCIFHSHASVLHARISQCLVKGAIAVSCIFRLNSRDTFFRANLVYECLMKLILPLIDTNIAKNPLSM